ncbi:MAG: hypothetical protein EB127_06295, partial [Alphaproteobacteria bacterium]|nr:hypothetical protein [Alphaproteobacteria bacterium]
MPSLNDCNIIIEIRMKYSSKIISSKMIFYIAQVITLVFLCTSGSSAAIKKPNTSVRTQASVKTDPLLDKIQSYLTELKTVGINFTQIDSSGAKYNGILLIKKPSMFRANRGGM